MSLHKPIFIHVPRTGGNTVRFMYRGRFRYHRHDAATTIRDRNPELFDKAWKFAFVRNPWERMASLYYHFHQSRFREMPEDLDGQREHFREWFHNPKPFTNSRGYEWMRAVTPTKMLLIDGKLAVDKVFKYEEIRQSHEFIAAKFGVGLHSLPRRKASRHDYTVRQLITNQQDIDEIGEIGEWEVKEFNYAYGN